MSHPSYPRTRQFYPIENLHPAGRSVTHSAQRLHTGHTRLRGSIRDTQGSHAALLILKMYLFRDKIHKAKSLKLFCCDWISTSYFHLWIILVFTCYDTSFTLGDAIIGEDRYRNMKIQKLLKYQLCPFYVMFPVSWCSISDIITYYSCFLWFCSPAWAITSSYHEVSWSHTTRHSR
jgi:hypothetical protein